MKILLQKLSKDNIGLAWSFHVSPDSCDNPEHYEQYLTLCALSEQEAGRGVTHVLLTLDDSGNITKESEILGFVTLRATSLVDSCDGKLYVMPSLEIAELAIDCKHERKGFGKTLVEAAIYIATELNNQYIGIQYVVLCADPKAVGFYENPKVGFGRLGDYYKILHDGWNDNCIPMYIKLSNK